MITIPLTTRYSETGQDGIIHHSSYVVYLEVARLEFFKTLGCDINQLEREKIFCPVVDLTVQYKKPLKSLEKIDVQVSLGDFSKVRFRLDYQILRQDELVATGSTSHCFVNESFKPIALPENVAKQFLKLQQTSL